MRVGHHGDGVSSRPWKQHQEWLASLLGEVRHHCAADKYASSVFRFRFRARQTDRPAYRIGARVRFLVRGRGLDIHVAMEQAIPGFRVWSRTRFPYSPTGIILGSGGPSARTIVEAADTTRYQGTKRVGPVQVPKAMSSTASATIRHLVQIKA